MGEFGTGGHSDNVVQFTRPGQVLFQAAPARSDPNWELAAAQSSPTRRRDGRNRPTARDRRDRRLPMTPRDRGPKQDAAPYTNFYPVNGGIIAPRLGNPDDEVGLRGYCGELFPGREVVGVPSRLPGVRRRRNRLHHAAGTGGHRAHLSLLRRGDALRRREPPPRRTTVAPSAESGTCSWTSGCFASSSRTALRTAPVPRPWITRTSARPARAAASTDRAPPPAPPARSARAGRSRPGGRSGSSPAR